MKKINFEVGTQVSPAKVTVNETEYNVTPAVWEGNTPLTPYTLNLLQENIEESCVAISPTTPTSNESVWIRKGKNLFNKNNTIDGIYLTETGEIATSSNLCLSDFIPVIPGEIYAYQSQVAEGTTPRSAFFDKDYKFISSFKRNDGTGTIVIPDNAFYVRFSIRLDTEVSDKDVFQFEIGTTATDFEEFIEEKILIKNNAGEFEEYSDVVVSPVRPAQGKVWIKKGKNRFNKNSIVSGNYLNSTGAITSNSGWCITDFISVGANEEYSYQGLTIAGTAPYSAYYDKDKNFISSFKQATGNNVITTPSNACYVRFSICLNDTQTGDVFDDINKFQFEQGPTTTDYEDYIEKEIYVKNDNGVFERFYKEEDTGWRDLEIVNGSAYSNDQIPQIRRIGKQVSIRGALKGITAEYTSLVKIPNDCIPSQTHSFTCPGSGKRHNRFQLDYASKTIVFNSTSLDIALTEDNWYPLCTTYFVD